MKPRLRGLLRFVLRLINPRSGFACETHLQTWAMQQPILGVCVLQAAILDRPRYSRNTAIEDRGGFFLGDQIAVRHRLLELRPNGRYFGLISLVLR